MARLYWKPQTAGFESLLMTTRSIKRWDQQPGVANIDTSTSSGWNHSHGQLVPGLALQSRAELLPRSDVRLICVLQCSG